MTRSTGKSADAKTRERSASEKRLLALFMWSIPLLFFLLLEGGLRIFGYGHSYPLFEPITGSEDYLIQNREVARRFFNREASIPTGIGDVFKASKDSSTTRIFVQGGSSAAGYPYYFGGSFSRMLEQRLQQTFPDRNIEIVNTGLAAVNSYTLLNFAREIIEQDPDAVLIYAGHNEFYGALGVGSVESLGNTRILVNSYLKLQKLRTVQAFRDLLLGAGTLFRSRRQGQPPGETLMERMVGERKIPLGSPDYRRGLDQFRGNLRSILARYAKAGIPVFVGTLASNERSHQPFISDLSAGVDAEKWEVLILEADRAAKQGDYETALSSIEDAIVLDTLSANAFFSKAKLLDAVDRYQEARTAYLKAKDRDQLRFRATEEMNQIIREEVGRAGAYVVTVQERLASAATNGIIGSDLMLEHLHPNVDGYFLIADAFYDAIRETELFETWEDVVPETTARQEILVTAIDSLYGAYRVQQLMGSWPFQPPGVVDRSTDSLQARNPIEKFALDLFRRKINWYEATTGLRSLYKERGEFHRALQAALAVIQQYPFLPRPYAEAAEIFVRQGRLEEALVYYEAANEREESAAVYLMMGNVELARRRGAAAAAHLERAVVLEPRNVEILVQLSKTYAVLERTDDARRILDQALTLDPRHQEALQLLTLIGQNELE